MRVLVGLVGECTSKKIDRVWDVTRVMRMPGTWNWRAGPDPDSARATGVIRWPDRERLSLADVTGEWARLVGGVGGGLGGLLERYGGIAGPAADDDDPGAYAGSWVGDIERIAHDTLTWAEVLEPHGWRCVSGNEMGISADEHEQVWERPGKGWETGRAVGTGDRSAVVYADREELLVVYSDSSATGFAAGLRGSGRRGEGAGVGVISKWRAWVDLAWAGDDREALDAVTGVSGAAGDSVAERLGEAWKTETDWMAEWVPVLEAGVMKAHEKAAGVGLPVERMLGWNPAEREP